MGDIKGVTAATNGQVLESTMEDLPAEERITTIKKRARKNMLSDGYAGQTLMKKAAKNYSIIESM